LISNSSIKRLWLYLAPRRKKQLTLLLVLMVGASLAEMIGIGAVLPFLGALISPEKLFQSKLIQPVIANLNINDPTQLLLPMTLIFIGASVTASVMRLMLLWAQIRLGHAIGADLSIQIYEKTLYQPYAVHASRNSSEIIAGISNKVNVVVLNTVLPLIAATSSLLLFLGILTALILIDPVVALAAVLVFGTTYAFIMIFSRNQLKLNSQLISREYGRAAKALHEGFGGIREVLIDGTQAVYCKIYQSADLPLRRAQANNQFIGASPRFLIEALGVVLIASLAYALTSREGGAVAAIPLLGALAIGAQRLLPVLQQLYASWSSLKGSESSLNDVLSLIEQPVPAYALESSIQPISFKKSIKLKNVSFRYSNQTPNVLEDINLEIKKGTMVGFMGTTGSGKSTLLDLVMALFEPGYGSLLIDETLINQRNFRAWQSHIAHVPQAIFLKDANIAENIAFGVPAEEIDHDRVRQVAQQAQIAKIIESWAHGYNTCVGERGIRLSGGQRQRIGIARALYKPADVIILDEATSALDNITEAAVIGAINALEKNTTILMIAHRLTTLKACDVIYELEAGQIIRQGNYEDIINLTKSAPHQTRSKS